ncbi:MAG: cupin domain-containing protein [Scytolyngbya sp. HA4215-MV1]|jgi:quercetin dioxygenase-like cupin family protein|nr:cupin domain-containing protein [Scytolyngbya sp. HA4215-MV1]
MLTPPLKPLATQLQDEVDYGDNGMSRKYLVKRPQHQAMLICLQAGIQIPEHTSTYDGFITVIQGRGVFVLAGQAVALEPGVFIELPANTLHALTAVEDLAILKVVDSHESQKSNPGNKKISCQDQGRENRSKQATCAESLVEMFKPYLQLLPLVDTSSPNPAEVNQRFGTNSDEVN